MSSGKLNVEDAVRERYSTAARTRVSDLCCRVSYDAGLLEVIPEEILERDYGCGDPSRHVRAGEDVLDLGSGGGKICYIAAQIVGREYPFPRQGSQTQSARSSSWCPKHPRR